MRAILTILFIVALAGSLLANHIVWHKGSVVLASKEVVVGEIARQGFELLLFRDRSGAVVSYPAHKVASFRYYDENENVNRAFIAVASPSLLGKTYKYYERVVYGKISVLRIQIIFDQVIDEKDANLYQFYIEEGRKVSSLKTFRKKYFDRIRDELDHQLVSYRHIDPNTNFGAVSLIMLYNKNTPSIASSAI